MRLKKILALVLILASFSSVNTVFADNKTQTAAGQTAAEETTKTTEAKNETKSGEEKAEDEETSSGKTDAELNLSRQYKDYRGLSKSVAGLYIDDTLTTEDIMTKGVSKLLENDEEMLIRILKAMVSSLDDYSEFFTVEEYREYQNAVNRTFYGLGITIQKNGDYVEIVGFAEENGLAQQSGFEVGDKIYKVGGVDVTGQSLQEVRSRMIGELGTTVNITVLRGDEEIELVGIRTEVKTSTANGGILKGNVGYIKIISFGTATSGEFTEILDNFREKNVKNIILDLRNNTGGLVKAATDIARQIVPEGKIVDVVYRDEKLNVSYSSEVKNPEFKFIVLVNGSTASSSEILASAIQDSGVGQLVGENTFGKAVVQTTHRLDNGMVIKLTTGQYITRNGNEINHIGLTPDVDIKNYSKKIDATLYTPMDFRTRVSMGDNGQNVAAAKERLSILGYFSGKTDDRVYYSDLQDAVTAFQIDNDLCANGVLDVVTQVKLEEIFEKLEVEVDRQLLTAYEMFGGTEDDLYQNSDE